MSLASPSLRSSGARHRSGLTLALALCAALVALLATSPALAIDKRAEAAAKAAIRKASSDYLSTNYDAGRDAPEEGRAHVRPGEVHAGHHGRLAA